MKRLVIFVAACTILLGTALAGCAKKAASSQEAIQASQALTTIQQKVDYLVGQANAFVDSKEFQNAIDVARHILENIDKNSIEAKNILDKAKKGLEAAAAAAAADMKKGLSDILK